MNLQNHDRTIIVVALCISFTINSLFWGYTKWVRRPVDEQVKIEQARAGVRKEDAEVLKSKIDNCKANGGKWNYERCEIK